MTSGAVPAVLELRALELPRNRPLDLVVGAGELVAVTGWDSADLLWTIAGLARADSGDVLVDGRQLTDREQAADAGVVLVPQGGALASLLTAYENVLLPLLPERATHPQTRDASRRAAPAQGAVAARRALEQVGLAESGDHLVEELSGGQQQRVAIARALAARPRVLLADQATTDLDPANRVRVLGLFRELADAGSAVLLASDDPVVTEACDRVVTL